MKRIQRESQDRPVCGTLWYLAFVLLAPVDIITTAALSDRIWKYHQIKIGPFQITFIRSAIVILLVLLFLNIKIKKITFDSLKGKPKGSLAFRCAQSGLVIILKTVLALNLSLTLISIVSNLQPMFVVFIAYFVVKEKLRIFELCVMVLTCIALGVIIWDGHESNGDPIGLDEIIYYILLFVQVLLVAGGTVALRKLKKFHESVLIWYTSWVTLLFSLILVYATGNSLSIVKIFNWGDWALIVATAVSSTTKQICKIKALQL